MDAAMTPVTLRASQAWVRAGLPQRYVKILPKGTPRYAGLLGAGAFGHVYKAYDREASRFVAVKVMLGPDAAKLARREYRLGARLDHPQLVATLAMGVSPNKRRPKAYLVLGYIEGDELTNWGRAPRQAIIDVRDVLRYLHAKRVTHNDIHSQNILVGDAHAWLIDLGRAQTHLPFVRRARREDVRMLCSSIEEGLFDRQHVWTVLGGVYDPTLQADFDSLKASSTFANWLRRGIVPERSQLFAQTFFSQALTLAEDFDP